MDVIGNVYTALRTWCHVEAVRLGYWASCVVTFLLPGCLLSSSAKSAAETNRKEAKLTKSPPVPDQLPSIVDIKRVLPKHCFEPDVRTSLYYVLKDFAIIGALLVLQLGVERLPFQLLYWVWTPTYCFLQGTMFWALFVLGHDCGHGSFSNSSLLNDVMGTALHTVIAVPFYPWKLSHKHHHKNTGNIDQDEIFYPVREKDLKPNIMTGYWKGFGLGLGWFVYLIIGFSPRNLSHFNPWENIFIGHTLGCISSLASLAGWGYLVYQYWQLAGTGALLVHYIAPVFVFASWLVVVTFLHHMDTGVPWYSNSKWDYVRGQLSTVDRHYGWAHELTHNIGTHQIHHLFTKIPHYRLEEATRAFREAYPDLIRQSGQSIMPAFFHNFDIFDAERLIRDDTDVHVWRGAKMDLKKQQ